ncbi:S24 family peptidase [Nitratireductor aquimarinus]|uniref:LexA family transcriptional regulator n=1 Tax=Nitratireductor aquimarinus TaxID=889300 RepID=UPI00398F6020
MTQFNMELNSINQARNSRHSELISNYGPGMTWDKRLREAFKATGWSKAELARRAQLSYDNINKYLAGAVKQPRGDALDRLAGALGIDPVFLERGIDATTGHTEVPVMGYLGAGAEVEPEFEQVPPEGIDQVEIPFPLPDDMIAFKVRGDSMLPAYKDGAVIVVYRDQQKPLTSFYGEEAAVRTSDGRRFIKTVMRGNNGFVNLLSWNASPIENVHLEWIGEIFAVIPPSALVSVGRSNGTNKA